MAGFYAVYHGAEGLRNIAGRIHSTAGFLAKELEKLGYTQLNKDYFDTLKTVSYTHLDVYKRQNLTKAQEETAYVEISAVNTNTLRVDMYHVQLNCALEKIESSISYRCV